jgi:hypothetical protein
MATGGRAGVEVEGGPQLRRAFRKLGDRADDLKPLHGDIADVVGDAADDRVPVMTGRLKRTRKDRATKTRAAVEYGGRAIPPYAGPIHFGWRARNIEPNPFLYDALDDRRGAVADKYAEGIGKMVQRFDIEAPK